MAIVDNSKTIHCKIHFNGLGAFVSEIHRVTSRLETNNFRNRILTFKKQRINNSFNYKS